MEGVHQGNAEGEFNVNRDQLGPNGVFIPLIGEGETRQSLQTRLDETRRLAESTRDMDESARLMQEASYLQAALRGTQQEGK